MDACSETEGGDFLVWVVILQYIANRFDSSQILILAKISFVVEWTWLVLVPIRRCEIDTDSELNLTASKNILEEGVACFEAYVLEGDHVFGGLPIGAVEVELVGAFADLG